MSVVGIGTAPFGKPPTRIKLGLLLVDIANRRDDRSLTIPIALPTVNLLGQTIHIARILLAQKYKICSSGAYMRTAVMDV
ncbi:MAG: hypothetical protein HOL51_14265 [Gemmatimonadetes bacterium]|nr:hypothetical protein [Gemmatimonadota bacterium]MBT5327277.1 hypothetical protein [Gemmatimonadota bacterium]MBT5449163.1 hypothetical protein [Gemmatimonadota bacterium]MBT5801176.1 hypothetical protein [Gemmatimonadota bacterium]MBT6619183.1 hypothetical protein [Gemmatimonadota bacterium]